MIFVRSILWCGNKNEKKMHSYCWCVKEHTAHTHTHIYRNARTDRVIGTIAVRDREQTLENRKSIDILKMSKLTNKQIQEF